MRGCDRCDFWKFMFHLHHVLMPCELCSLLSLMALLATAVWVSLEVLCCQMYKLLFASMHRRFWGHIDGCSSLNTF